MFALTPFNNNNRRLAHRSPMSDFDDLFNRLMWAPNMAGSRLFRDFDLYEQDGKLFLSIEAPGMNPDDLEIRTTKESVSIKCKNEATEESEKVQDDKKWYNKKTSCAFNYEISLPFEIDTNKAEATFEHGMIKITAPRLEVEESKVLELKKP